MSLFKCLSTFYSKKIYEVYLMFDIKKWGNFECCNPWGMVYKSTLSEHQKLNLTILTLESSRDFRVPHRVGRTSVVVWGQIRKLRLPSSPFIHQHQPMHASAKGMELEQIMVQDARLPLWMPWMTEKMASGHHTTASPILMTLLQNPQFFPKKIIFTLHKMV